MGKIYDTKMFSHKNLPPGASSIEKSLLKGFETRAYRLPGDKFGGFQRRVKLCLAIAVLSVSAWFLAVSLSCIATGAGSSWKRC